MCGRYVPPSEAAIEREWQITKAIPEFPPRWNVAPGAIVPVLRRSAAGELKVVSARWGLIPHWWKDAKPPSSSFNARLEDAAVKPMWRDAIRRARCLVPARGWYEWRKPAARTSEGRSRKAAGQPYYIHRGDGGLIAFAGLAAAWRAPGQDAWVVSCAIVTVAATGALAEIHDRMPAALPRDAQDAWLSADTTDGIAGAEFVRSAVSIAGLQHYRVGTRVNSALSEGPDLVEPVMSDE
jgi:putative SOS response-associated peptidase YedK